MERLEVLRIAKLTIAKFVPTKRRADVCRVRRRLPFFNKVVIL